MKIIPIIIYVIVTFALFLWWKRDYVREIDNDSLYLLVFDKDKNKTGCQGAMATMVEHEMKKGKNSSFIYYNEKKIDK